MKRILYFAIPAALLSLGLTLAQQSDSRLAADTFRALEMRNIPGTFTSGRIADVAIDPRNRSVWYVASASGGLWKTVNHGLNFEPIFEGGGSYSLGCVTVDAKNPDTVWLGTGENQAQRAIGYGDGIYKSTDAGKTWKNMGLANSEHIAKILISTQDSNTVFVASQGPLFSPGGDRGLFKTTDGGATWKPILQVSENTGITDLEIDPRKPAVMYAASYQRRRNTSVIVAGGPESGIYKTTDGGAHWSKINEGLPTADKGRIAIALSPQKPDILYATVAVHRTDQKTEFYRSEDAGAHWTHMGDWSLQDPEYYGEIYADPHEFDHVYIMDTAIRLTPDGGKTINNAGFQIHADNHSITFDPTDAQHLMVGNDGGLWESYDHGRTWRHFNNIPVTQFYRGTADNGLPFYNIYGGTQDNGSMGIPSRTNVRAGIRTSDWLNTGGGDGYQSRVDPEDPSIVYSCSQNIGCLRLDLRTGVSTSIHPAIATREIRSRWDLPFIISPHSHTRLYIMGNRLMRSDDRGATWRFVSPEITRNIDRDTLPVMGKVWGPDAVWKNAFTDSYGTGTALAESPLKEGLIFAGTDDGLLDISENNGLDWRKVEKFPGVPDMTYITDVFPSPVDVNTVFLTANDFQRGNFKPYVLKSTDLGRTWTSIGGDLPQRDPVWTIVQDHLNPNLLFIGTEFGLSFSVDGGKHWIPIKGGMPTITIRDLEIQRRESDLVAASFGRGLYVLDDFAALRQIDPNVFTEEATLFAVGRRARAYDEIGYYRAQGDNIASPNPPMGALLTYYLRDDFTGTDGAKMVLNIADSTGKMVRQIDASAKSGLHRTPWDLRETAPPAPAGGGRGGRRGSGDAAATPQAGAPPTEPPAEEATTPPAGRGGAGGAGGGGGRGGFGGRGGRSGPLVRPGTYTVTLGKLAAGTFTAVGKPQTVEVVPLEPSNR
jgi:photosystem II stability/assembly factor-like uncharacterized protein